MPLTQTLLPMPANKRDRARTTRMLSLPDKLRSLARQMLDRVRVGLDIPSRAEVLDLATRIEAISGQLERLEQRRASDAQLVADLRDQAVAEQAKAKSPRAKRRAKAPASSPKAVSPGEGTLASKPKSSEGAPKKRKRTTKAVSPAKDK